MVMEVAGRDAEYIRDLEEYITGNITTHRNLNNFHFIMLYQTHILPPTCISINIDANCLVIYTIYINSLIPVV